MGVPGRTILPALIDGLADPATIAGFAKERLWNQIPVLERVLTGLGATIICD
jgi:hypothetical protein